MPASPEIAKNDTESPEHVLVVTTNTYSGIHLSHWLTLDGYEVKVAFHPQQAIRLAQIGAPDAVVLDMENPSSCISVSLDVWELHPDERPVTIVLCERIHLELASAHKHGIVDHVVLKPAKPGALAAMVRPLLSVPSPLRKQRTAKRFTPNLNTLF